ncbi:MAG: prephenate dehydrogenase [Candidatus Sumerlaeaceae bacterium]|nr:prephenate dehydrogenase [Candidatus Sumerlaeaceae bacterium]
MEPAFFPRIAVVGVGLLGGSLGLAARQRKLCREVIGVGRSRPALEEALRLEAVDQVSTDLAEGVADADLIILCTPVGHILDTLPQVLAAAKPGAIVTDVGSTKSAIVRAGEETATRLGKLFVGSHPMAGSEKSGVRYAKPDLFEESTCFVTKTTQTDPLAFSSVCRFWMALETRLVLCRPERHDRLVALVSHLPHMVAVALVQAVESLGEDKNLIRGIIGNGFRDTTRIAHGSADMWEDICAQNNGEIANVRKAFDDAVARVFDSIQNQDPALKAMLQNASEYRGFLDNH